MNGDRNTFPKEGNNRAKIRKVIPGCYNEITPIG
jgi:hypothetical protein